MTGPRTAKTSGWYRCSLACCFGLVPRFEELLFADRLFGDKAAEGQLSLRLRLESLNAAAAVVRRPGVSWLPWLGFNWLGLASCCLTSSEIPHSVDCGTTLLHSLNRLLQTGACCCASPWGGYFHRVVSFQSNLIGCRLLLRLPRLTCPDRCLGSPKTWSSTARGSSLVGSLPLQIPPPACCCWQASSCCGAQCPTPLDWPIVALPVLE